MAEPWQLMPSDYEVLARVRDTKPVVAAEPTLRIFSLSVDKLIVKTMFSSPQRWQLSRLGECAVELYEARAAIAAWVSAKDAEAAYHTAHGDGFVSHDEATVLAMEAAIDTAEDALRAIVAGEGQVPE